jgi:glycosyltransferase involved in cell wall biosynthesis
MHSLVTTTTASTSTKSVRKVLAVELEAFGHRPAYIQNIADIWVDANLDGEIEFLLTRRFRESHQNTIEYIEKLADPRVGVRFLTDSEEAILAQPRRMYWNGWKIFCKRAREGGANHGLLLHFDPFQLPVWLGEKSPIPFSAIYFRPTFHYWQYAGHQPTIRDILVSWRKSFLLQRVLRRPQMRELLSLDATAVPYIRSHFRTTARISHFADSFPRTKTTEEQIATLRRELGIDAGRIVFCMIGVLDDRKGPLQLLESVRHLPDDAAGKVCLLLIGRPTDELRAPLLQAVAALSKNETKSHVQVILRSEYIPPSEVQSYYALSDVMLTTYQLHKGSSSALIRAAYEKKPVLSSNYGWLGHMVRTYRMGIEIDSTDPRQIASGIVRFVSSNPSSLIDTSKCEQLAFDNSQEKMAADLQRMLQCDLRPSSQRQEKGSVAEAR